MTGQRGSMTAEQVRAIRQALGLSQRELAGQIGCGKRTLAAWEAGELAPTDYRYVARLRELGAEAVVAARALLDTLGEIPPA